MPTEPERIIGELAIENQRLRAEVARLESRQLPLRMLLLVLGVLLLGLAAYEVKRRWTMPSS